MITASRDADNTVMKEYIKQGHKKFNKGIKAMAIQNNEGQYCIAAEIFLHKNTRKKLNNMSIWSNIVHLLLFICDIVKPYAG